MSKRRPRGTGALFTGDVEPACRHDPEAFFPVGDKASSREQIEYAKNICRGCPLLEPCRRWILAVGDDWCVAAGTTPAERRALRGSDARARVAA